MDYKEELINRINHFTIDIIEEFKEAEVAIFEDSRFSRIFKNKDYQGHIDTIRKCKKETQAMKINDVPIPDEDVPAKDLVRFTERCMVSFSAVCDSYIQLQKLLQNKAEGDKVGYIEYKKYYKHVEEMRTNFNNLLRELDIAYTDYTLENQKSGGEGEFLTYFDIAGEDE